MLVQKFLLIASIWLLCGVLGLGYLVACIEANKLTTLTRESKAFITLGGLCSLIIIIGLLIDKKGYKNIFEDGFKLW